MMRYLAEFYGPCGLLDAEITDDSLEYLIEYAKDSIASKYNDHVKIIISDREQIVWQWERKDKICPVCNACMYWNGTACTCDGQFMVYYEYTFLEADPFCVRIDRGDGFTTEEWDALLRGECIMRGGVRNWLWQRA